MDSVSHTCSANCKSQSSDARRASRAVLANLRILVAIASYGRKQDAFLARVIGEYRSSVAQYRIVVLTDAPKPVSGADVVVGLPSRNTYSLPFSHRRLFCDNVDDYDVFVYTEDDTLLTEAHIGACLDVQRHLGEWEVPGFVRSETSSDGQCYITSANTMFRWQPETLESRDGELFAAFSNEHSGCFVVTQRQLRRAIESGGFMVPPHDEMYGMLESAASDIYRQCGLQRRLCLSRIHEFVVPHLANKYYATMGLPWEEFKRQIGALHRIYQERGWRGSLFEPQSRASRFQWSKNLYCGAERSILRAIIGRPGRVLSVGVACGRLEEVLATAGVDVTSIGLDAVFADVLRSKGINALDGPLDQCLRRLSGCRFDTIVLEDVLHLVERPSEWLFKLREVLAPGGLLIAKVANTGEIASWAKDALRGRVRSRYPQYEIAGVHPISPGILRKWLGEAGLVTMSVLPVVEEHRESRLGWCGRGWRANVFADFFVAYASHGAPVDRKEGRV